METDSPVEIDVIIPYFDGAIRLEDQVEAMIEDAPFKRRVVLPPGIELAQPTSVLPPLTAEERSRLLTAKSVDPKRPFPSFRLLGRYALVRKMSDDQFVVIAQGSRSWSYKNPRVSVQPGDIFILLELEGCF